MNRRRLFALLAFASVGYAAILAGAFLIYAVQALGNIPPVIPSGSPLADIGIAIGAVIAGLGVLIASVRYLIIPRVSEVWEQKQPPSQ